MHKRSQVIISEGSLGPNTNMFFPPWLPGKFVCKSDTNLHKTNMYYAYKYKYMVDTHFVIGRYLIFM